jgi:hypothetical protein
MAAGMIAFVNGEPEQPTEPKRTRTRRRKAAGEN